MSIVQKMKQDVRELQTRIEVIQAQCSHPPYAVTRVAKADTGNYDPTQDRYWYVCDCGLCEKHWEEPQ